MISAAGTDAVDGSVIDDADDLNSSHQSDLVLVCRSQECGVYRTSALMCSVVHGLCIKGFYRSQKVLITQIKT